MTEVDDRAAHSPIWQRRFDFYDRYGLPSSSPEARAAFKALPFGTRMRINSNLPAFLFGPIYFFVKGVWRKGLSLLLIAVAVGIVLYGVNASDGVTRGVSMGIAVVQLSVANYAYYLHHAKHSQSWNPFEGFGRRKTL